MDALVKNAADEKQVKSAKQKERSQRDKELSDMAFILSSPEGRRFIWRMLGHCRVFETIWHSSAMIHYNSGRQDVGHFILSDVNDASPESLLLMMKENRKDK